MSKPVITVAISGLNNTDNPGPGIPVARGLLEATSFDARIIGLAYENMEPGIYLPHIVSRVYQVPYPSAGMQPLFDRLAFINAAEKIDVLIPNFDAELYSFIKAKEKLAAMGISMVLPTLEQFEERHKSNLPEYGKRYGALVPRSIPVMSISEMNRACKEFSYPAVIKGKFYDAVVAQNLEQASAAFNKIAAKWGLPIVVQQFVRGTEVNVIALGNGKGDTIAAVPMRKTIITDKGKAWGGVTLDDDSMLSLTRSLIRQTKWQGGMELELIRTDDGKLYIIEINPRIPAWVYLAVGAGQNIPEALVNLAMGKNVEPFSTYKVGQMFIRYSLDNLVSMEQFEKLTLTGQI